MIPDPESSSPADHGAGAQPSDPARRRGPSRRGGRGRGRGRGRRPPEQAREPTGDTSQPAEVPAAPSAEMPASAALPEPVGEATEPPPADHAAPPERLPEKRPAEPAAVKDAIDTVNRIVALLKEALDDMEDVLETIEVAERQKTADEQEIESLRRSLSRLHRPHDRGHHHH